ncbi:PAS domain S-box protein [Methanosarcina hadiensis]|uniref:PAS domain S-box protein n=1 Tax=Methanosarcina hadiensis TaxID=3078083 RepID=UPI003977BE86
MRGQVRKSGIDIIGDVSWGTHFCQFYQTKEDLMDILIPYFKAGLESNEFCLWVISEALSIEEAKEALKKTVPDFDDYVKRGQIEIIPDTCYYLQGSVFDPDKTLKIGAEKINQALACGYDGFRSSGDISWPRKTDWKSFTDYEEKIDRGTGNCRAIILCTYPLDRYNVTEIIDAVTNHQFTLIKREGKWERIESPRRKIAEETAIRAAKNWEYTFDAVPDLIAILDAEYRIVRANKAMAARLGITPEECEGLTCYRVIHGTDEPPSFCPYSKLLRDGLEHTEEVREDSLGGNFILSVLPLHDSKGKIVGCTHFARDITERKRLEEQTRQRAEEIETVMEVAPVAIWISHDPQCHNITGNRMANEFYEAQSGENVSASATPLRRFFKKGLELTAEELPMQKAALKNIAVRNEEIDVLLRSGEWRGLLGSASPLHDAKGNVRGSVGAFIDITERKKVEEELRRSEQKYRNLIETANEGIWMLEWEPDTGARTTYVNEKMAEMLGYSREEMIGKSVRDFTDKEGKAVLEMNMKRRQQGINESHEFRLLHKDGLPLWALVNSKSLFNDNGKFAGSISMLTDITGRKEAENKLKETLDNLERLVEERTVELEKAYNSLKESEISLSEAQRIAHIGNWDWNLVTGEMYWSDELYRIFGRDPQESGATYNEFLSYAHPDDQNYVENAVKNGMTGEPLAIDYRIVLANGEELTVHLQPEIIFDDRNNPVRVKGTVQDITGRKKAEKALELSEERYRIITEQTGQLVYDYDIEKDIADLAGNIEELTGFTHNELGSVNLSLWTSRIHPEDLNRFMENHKRYLVPDRGAHRTEYRFRKKNGEYIFLEENWVCPRDGKENPNRILGVIKNITEIKRAENTLANVEIARKKEIHHRIKNNLQVISSLLDLQAEKFKVREHIKDSEVLTAFRESQDRVISIALIHEELHEGRGKDTLNFSIYLHRLVKNLFQTYSLGDANISLSMDLQENIFFDMDTAVPLGLIVNELVSNSLKYAFRGRDGGVIRIRLSREENKAYTGSRAENRKEGYGNTGFVLTISDNGIGISEDFIVEDSDTLGIQLVTTLVDQLDGELEINRSYGTEFKISFSVSEKE